jgi:ectoine hydroxylase-related dioxygenase (phytanoyl-CoA dioxygenase family)
MVRISDAVIIEAFAKLERDGYCVIEGVVAPEKCASVRARIHSYLKEAGIDFADPTLKPSEWPHTSAGILQALAIGQTQAVHDIREDEMIDYIFALLHGDNDQIRSADGVCIQPINLTAGKLRMHVDQSHLKPGRLCIQSLVNLTPALDEGTGTLMIIPGGHLKHSEFAAKYPDRIKSADWFQYDEADYEMLGGQPVRVFGGVGSLVMWDSRTPHCGAPPFKTLPAGIVRRERNVVYVSGLPRRTISKRAQAKMAKIYNERRMSSHWADARKTFPAKVSTFRRPHLRATRIPITDDRTRSARQLELCGVTQMTTRSRVLTAPALRFDYVDAKK